MHDSVAPRRLDLVRVRCSSACCGTFLSAMRFYRFRNSFCHFGTRWHAVLRDLSEAKRVEARAYEHPQLPFSTRRILPCWPDTRSPPRQTSLRDFLATTSHDARTPLNSIQVAAALLRERSLTEEAAELLTAITASSRVLHLLIGNVMITKKMDQGDCDLSPSPVAIRDVIADVCATTRAGLAQPAGSTLVWEETPLPARILSRAEELSQLLLNVTCFCMQSADGAPVGIRASCDAAPALDAAGRTHVLLLRVSFGRALSEEALSNVFDPYSAAKPDWLDKGRGSGRLGLHVSRRLARALGGDMVVTSGAGAGTTFSASLPVSLFDDTGATPPTTPRPASASGAAAAAAPQPPGSLPRTIIREPEVETGLLPFLRPDMPPSESLESMKQRGKVYIAADLVRALSACVVSQLGSDSLPPQLLANTPDAYIAAEGPYLRYLSPGAMQLLQYESMEDVPPQILSLVHPDDAGRVSDCWQAARAQSTLQNGNTVAVSVTFRCLRKDGSYVCVESQTCVTPTHLYAVSSDISERMQREASLRGFLASVMADMRQPLSSLQAATELLAARMCVRSDEESAFLVSAIAAGCAMLCGIVSNVLSFRSMEAGDCVVDAVPCSVRDVVASVLSVCRMSLAHRTDVSIVWADEAEAEARLPPSVLCDKRLLSQVLLNLLTSACLPAALPRCRGLCLLTAARLCCADAVKFAEGTQVTVSVACAPAAGAEDAAQQLLTLSVADRGRGMSAEEQESCFLPYVRSPTSRGGGTGLGAWRPQWACTDACSCQARIG